MNRLFRTDWVVIEGEDLYEIEAAPNVYFYPGAEVVAACPTRLAARAALRLLTHPSGPIPTPSEDGTLEDENS